MHYKHASLSKHTAFRLAALLVGILLMFFFIPYQNTVQAKAEGEVAALITYLDMAPVYAEKGVSFSVDALPTSHKIVAALPNGDRATLTAEIAWEITDAERNKAASANDFSIRGNYTNAASDDGDLYALSGELGVETTVIFTDRTTIDTLSVQLRPYYRRNSDTIITMDVFIVVKGRFSPDAAHAFECSFGDAFHVVDSALAWDYAKNVENGTNEFTAYLSFVNDQYATPGEITFTDAELSHMIQNRVYFRLNTSDGLFAGYSNTVAIIDGEAAPTDDDKDIDADSGVLDPLNPSTGNKGGGTSFFTTPSGTATAVVICVLAVILSVGGGYVLCLLWSKRKANKVSDGDD